MRCYRGQRITVHIRDGVVQGRFRRRALALVLKWLDLHREVLLEDWGFAREGAPLKPILHFNRKHASGGCKLEELLTVVEARHVRDDVLWLRFSDGLVGEVDLRGRLRGRVFEPLKEIAQFSQLRSSRRSRRLRVRTGPILRQRSSGDVASSTRFSTALLVRRINALASERRRLAVAAGPPSHRMVRTS